MKIKLSSDELTQALLEFALKKVKIPKIATSVSTPDIEISEDGAEFELVFKEIKQ